MRRVCLVASGAGALGLTEAAALETLAAAGYTFAAAGGASAGSINSAAVAFRIASPAKLWSDLLASGKLEDWKCDLPGRLGNIELPVHAAGILEGPGHGMLRGAAIRAALNEALGSNTRMGDSPIPLRVVVGNLSLRRNQTVDSELERYKRVKVVDAVMCSLAVPFVIDAQQLEPSSPVLYADGGTANNVPAALFDDLPDPTLVLRFAAEAPVADDSLGRHLEAVFGLLRAGAEDERSSKPTARDLLMPAVANALDFAPPAETIEAIAAAGRAAARAFLAGGAA